MEVKMDINCYKSTNCSMLKAEALSEYTIIYFDC